MHQRRRTKTGHFRHFSRWLDDFKFTAYTRKTFRTLPASERSVAMGFPVDRLTLHMFITFLRFFLSLSLAPLGRLVPL